MKTAVRYYSLGGNTAKVAEAIASALDVPALTTDVPLTEDVDILFLGSAVYAFGVDDHIKNFIAGIDHKVGKVVNFSTAAAVRSTYRMVGKLLKEKGLVQAEEEFYCRGAFGPMHKGRPNEEDLKNAAEFARRVAGK